MAHSTEQISEGPAVYEYIERPLLTDKETYTMPGGAVVTIETLDDTYAVYWPTNLTPVEAYKSISSNLAHDAVVISSRTKLKEPRKPVMTLGANNIDTILANHADGTSKIGLDDYRYWGVEYSGFSYVYIQREEGEPNEIKMYVDTVADIVPTMRYTAVPELIERGAQYFDPQ